MEPFAATASTQRALVLARSGELERAADAAREATREEPTNYRTWLLLASLDAERGRAARAIAAYDTAYDQNPHSIAFVRESPSGVRLPPQGMTGPRDNEPFPDPGLASEQSRQLAELARRLERERPLPRAGFRARRRAGLLRTAGERALVRGRLRLRVAAYAGSGLTLLAIAALGSRAGPLAGVSATRTRPSAG